MPAPFLTLSSVLVVAFVTVLVVVELPEPEELFPLFEFPVLSVVVLIVT